jgi:uncharacterized protein YebE (UPF0316 family)
MNGLILKHIRLISLGGLLMLINIILIFALQLLYVPVLTLRTIFLVKNMSVAASTFGVLEALVYVFGLSLVFSGHQSIAEMVVYAVGFGVGLYIGTRIENKLAIGYTCLMVNLMEINEELIDLLRNKGFGVTVFEGMGRDSKRFQLEILTKRNRENEVMDLIEEYEPKAFIISYEPRKFKGGYLIKSMKKYWKKGSAVKQI